MSVDWRPPNLRKAGARSTNDRESALLDNFEVVREIYAGCLTNPSTMDLIDSAKSMGFEVAPMMHDEDTKQHLYVVKQGDKIVAVLYSCKGSAELFPSENAW